MIFDRLFKRKETPKEASKVAVMMINREVRRVPLHWQHPKDAAGNYLSLYDRAGLTEKRLAEYMEDNPSCTREEIMEWFMPDFSAVPADQMGIAVYETTTEGTPMSPVFPDTPRGRFALLEYCRKHVSTFGDHRCDRLEGWRELLFRDRAVVDPKRKIVSYVSSPELVEATP